MFSFPKRDLKSFIKSFHSKFLKKKWAPVAWNNWAPAPALENPPRASPLLTLMPAPSPPAPWALKRDTSHILRSILEDKPGAKKSAAVPALPSFGEQNCEGWKLNLKKMLLKPKAFN